MAQADPATISTSCAASAQHLPSSLANNGPDEGSAEGHDQGRDRRGLGNRVRAEEVCLREDDRQLGGDREQGGVQHWCLHLARAVQDQDAHEAGDESRRAGGLRQGGDGEGEAGAEGREGLPCEGSQGQRLSCESGLRCATATSPASIHCPWALCGMGRQGEACSKLHPERSCQQRALMYSLWS